VAQGRVYAASGPVGGSILVDNDLLAMDVAALVVSIVSLVISTVIAAHHQRWQRLIAKLERLDPGKPSIFNGNPWSATRLDKMGPRP
jgi:hypothetical protein